MDKIKHIIIVAGGMLSRACIEEHLKKPEQTYIIGVDRGLVTLQKYNIKPDLAVGDFDSAGDDIRAIYKDSPDAIILQPEKDYTDTHVAVLEALKLRPKQITILGATGGRIDHLMANIGLLKIILISGVEGCIIDDYNRITMIDKKWEVTEKQRYGRYISCIPFSDKVTGLTIEGCKYPLENAVLTKEVSLGVSNELVEEVGRISIDTGYLMVIEARD